MEVYAAVGIGPNESAPRPSSTCLGSLMRCCVAFGVSELVAVNCGKISTFGSHGSARHLKVVHVRSWEEARAHFTRVDCDVVGILDGYDSLQEHRGELNAHSGKNVEVAEPEEPKAKFVGDRPFRRSTAFVVLKDRGIREGDAALGACDSFVYVRKHQPVRLDLIVEFSITLHHYTAWAKFDRRSYVGQKYELNAVHFRHELQGSAQGEEVRNDRDRRKQLQYLEAMSRDSAGHAESKLGLFGEACAFDY